MTKHAGRRLSATLTRGEIAVDILDARWSGADLFDFAERDNPKRAFLFVSKVLGRHIPARPSVMRAAFEALAAQLPDALPGPVAFIGFAETAVGLGAGVHRSFVTQSSRTDTLYLSTTRYALDAPLLCAFHEEHSHATAHVVYRPVDPALAERLADARTLVLVDDETSTGRTAANLIRALPPSLTSQLKAIVLATLTDWSAGARPAFEDDRFSRVSLIAGRYHWRPNPGGDAPTESAAPVRPAQATKPVWLANTDLHPARLGRTLERPPETPVTAQGRTLVLGTGEYVWGPYLLAEALETAGADVRFSAVTRSPILPGHAIGAKISCRDNYGEGVNNYLYNVRADDYETILQCSETPAASLDPALIAALGRPRIVCPNGA